MPFDLMRHDMLMTLKPISPERIRSVVDDLFIPLITQHGAHLKAGNSEGR
jgi:hypothetical protein